MAPVYAPEVVATAILACAQSPHRNLRVGGAARMLTAIEKLAPGLGDRIKERTAFEGSKTNRPAKDDDTLYAPRAGDARLYGSYEGRVKGTSLYTKVAMNPIPALLGAAVLGLGIAGLLHSRRD